MAYRMRTINYDTDADLPVGELLTINAEYGEDMYSLAPVILIIEGKSVPGCIVIKNGDKAVATAVAGTTAVLSEMGMDKESAFDFFSSMLKDLEAMGIEDENGVMRVPPKSPLN